MRAGLYAAAALALFGCRTVILDADAVGLEHLPPAIEVTAPMTASDLVPTGDPAPMRLGPGDELVIQIIGRPELGSQGADGESRKTIVEADGRIALPFLGRVQAAGLTPMELFDEVKDLHGALAANPQAVLTIAAWRSQRVQVSGEVTVTGPVVLTPERRTLADILALAGGLTEDANGGGGVLTRDGERYAIDWTAATREGSALLTLTLEDGDAIHFPSLDDLVVHVFGEVGRQGAQPIPEDGLTILEALSRAVGPNPVSAAQDRLYIVRTALAGGPFTVELTLEELFLAPNTPAAAGDTLYVPPTTLITWQRTFQQLFPFIGGASLSSVRAATN